MPQTAQLPPAALFAGSLAGLRWPAFGGPVAEAVWWVGGIMFLTSSRRGSRSAILAGSDERPPRKSPCHDVHLHRIVPQPMTFREDPNNRPPSERR